MSPEIVQRLVAEAGAEAAAVAYADLATGASWAHDGDRVFHAASLVKAAVLLGLLDAVARGRFALDDRLHVRNRFISAADGRAFRVDAARDANAAVPGRLGRTMPLGVLARHMIQTSSNLATNLLLDLVGVDAVRAALDARGIEGVAVRRGVEDERAYEAGLVNTGTARGFAALFGALAEGAGLPEALRETAVEILAGQEFRSGIPAGLPEAVRGAARVAHKTGSISTVQHDAGLVYLPDGDGGLRRPYALALLTEWDAGRTEGRTDLVAALSRAVYEHLTSAPPAGRADG